MCEKKIELLYESINKNKSRGGALMPILHDAQHIFGCIPIEVQKLISKELDISVAKINGVVTFYSQFSVTPKGKNIIGVCLGTACYVRGSQQLLDTFSSELKLKPSETSKDMKYTLEATRCIGACGLAPVFTVNQVVYGKSDSKKVKKVVEELINQEVES